MEPALFLTLTLTPNPKPNPNPDPNPNQVRVGTWNLLGGRRWKLEHSAHVTAAREVREETGGALSDGMVKVPLLGSAPSSAPLPLQGAPGGSGQLGAPREEAGPLGAQPCCWRSS